MTLKSIKLNPSQERTLQKALEDFFGTRESLSFDKKSGRLFCEVLEKKPVFLRPLLCLLPKDFDKEEFLSIKRMEILGPKEAGEIFYFPTAIQSGRRFIECSLPCAFFYDFKKPFDLQRIFAAAESSAQKGKNESGSNPFEEKKRRRNEKDFFFAPTSFKFCRVEIFQNEWRLYDDIWKKLR